MIVVTVAVGGRAVWAVLTDQTQVWRRSSVGPAADDIVTRISCRIEQQPVGSKVEGSERFDD